MAQFVPLDNVESYADPNPTTNVESRELRRAVERRLAQLPEEQKTVFVLRTFEDMSYKEISDVLGISIGTVMSRLNRARGKMKELLSDYLTKP